jgi:hypothetical protein
MWPKLVHQVNTQLSHATPPAGWWEWHRALKLPGCLTCAGACPVWPTLACQCLSVALLPPASEKDWIYTSLYQQLTLGFYTRQAFVGPHSWHLVHLSKSHWWTFTCSTFSQLPFAYWAVASQPWPWSSLPWATWGDLSVFPLGLDPKGMLKVPSHLFCLSTCVMDT